MDPAPEPFDTGLAPEELDPERPRPFDTPWGSYALHTVDGRVVAAQSFCPHMQGPLFEGTRSGPEITCPWHSWRFSLETGECTASPDPEARHSRLRFCDVRVGAKGTFELTPRGA